MKKIQSLLLVFIVGVILTGCAPSFDIDPKYDEKNKIVTIDNYVINGISYFNKRKSNIDMETMGSTGYLIKEARSNYGICDYIYTIDHEATGDWYYTSSVLDDLRMQYNNNCEVEKIGRNIDFVDCNNNYYVTSSRPSEFGYSKLIKIKMDYGCFQDMKIHFKNVVNNNSKAPIKKQESKEKKEIKIKKEIKKASFKSSYYTGKFSSFSDSNSCQMNGDLDAYVKGNDVVLTFYNDIDGYISVDLIKGKITGRKFNIDSNNIKSKGDIYRWTVTGTYKYKNCEGSFEANLDED